MSATEYVPGIGGGRVPNGARRPLVWRAARAILRAHGRATMANGTPRAYARHARLRDALSPIARRYSPARRA